jgi:hypothetical protein
MDVLLQNSPTTAQSTQSQHHIILITDASDMGLAAIWVESTKITTLTQPLSRQKDLTPIVFREADAMIMAVEWKIRSLSKRSLISYYCDNTSWLGALRRGWSPSYDLNRQVIAIFRLLHNTSTSIALYYISSEDNPADGPSRGLSTTLDEPILASATAVGWAPGGTRS